MHHLLISTLIRGLCCIITLIRGIYCSRLCLHPLLHDLSGASFASGRSSQSLNLLQNPDNLNAKGINSASIYNYYYPSSGIVYLTNPNSQNYINFVNDYSIQLTLPKVSLINAIWWSNYYKVI